MKDQTFGHQLNDAQKKVTDLSKLDLIDQALLKNVSGGKHVNHCYTDASCENSNDCRHDFCWHWEPDS